MMNKIIDERINDLEDENRRLNDILRIHENVFLNLEKEQERMNKSLNALADSTSRFTAASTKNAEETRELLALIIERISK